MTREPEAISKQDQPQSRALSPALFRSGKVFWRPWSAQTFDLARQTNKPIFLSIGFDACQWCQTMRASVFQADEVSQFLNANFVCIGLDREQWTDVDSVYQTAHSLLNGSASGWPLNAILCPQTRLPFSSGTYFELQPADPDQLSFMDWLQRSLNFFVTQPASYTRLVRQLGSNLASVTQSPAVLEELPNLSFIGAACEALSGLMDAEHGGFLGVPKFVSPSTLCFLLDAKAKGLLPMRDEAWLWQTLSMLSERGVHDGLEGGFFRYCYDKQWHRPVSEKMLFDNAMLIEVYSLAWQLTGKLQYSAMVRSVLTWVKRHLGQREGLFYSATYSAQSSYYTVDLASLDELLDERERQIFDVLYGGDQFAAGSVVGLSKRCSLSQLSRELRLSPGKLADGLEGLHRKLLRHRQRQLPPKSVNNRLCGANGLLLRAMARAAVAVPEVISDALSLANSIRRHLWVNNRLFCGLYEEGLGRHAQAEDYAFVLDGLMHLLQVRWDDELYRWSISLAESLLMLHEDPEYGGFYQSPSDAQPLLFRFKSYLDGALPSAVGVSASALLALSRLSGEPRYRQAAIRAIRSAGETLGRSPRHCLSLVKAHEDLINPKPLVVIADNGLGARWAATVRKAFDHQFPCYLLPADAEQLPLAAMYLDPGEVLVSCAEDDDTVLTELEAVLDFLSKQATERGAKSVSPDSRPEVALAHP